MKNGISLGNIMIDCGDAELLREFYNKLLGWEKLEIYGCPGLTDSKGTVFLFAEEEDYVPPVWPEEEGKQQKQMHFDFKVADLTASVEYALTLGAVKAQAQYGEGEFVTMLDPAGHPFCLCA